MSEKAKSEFKHKVYQAVLAADEDDLDIWDALDCMRDLYVDITLRTWTSVLTGDDSLFRTSKGEIDDTRKMIQSHADKIPVVLYARMELADKCKKERESHGGHFTADELCDKVMGKKE